MIRTIVKKARTIMLSNLPVSGAADPLILCFHTVRDSGNRAGYVSDFRSQPVEIFAAQLAWLDGFCDFVSLDDILLRDQQSPSGRQRVAVTFDDGYRDNLLAVLPLLESYSAPVTLFVATEYLANRTLPWWDFMDWTIEHGYLCNLEAGTVHKAKLSAKQAASQREHFRAVCRDGNQTIRDELVSAMAEKCGCSETNDFMSKDELSEFVRSPLTAIGAHTHTHMNTALLTPDELADELRINLEALSELRDSRVKYFAFPYGSEAQIHPECHSILEGAGLTAAFTTTPSCIEDKHGRYDIPRIIVSPRSDLAEFKALVKQKLLKNKYPSIGVFSSL